MTIKMKKVIAVILCVITVTAGFAATPGVPQIAYAQNAEISEKAIATRNEVTVAVGDKSVKIVAYNIDGYNYFRVADLCKALNMKVFYYPTDLGDGVKIISNEAFDGNLEDSPTEKRLDVSVKDINVFYDGGYIKAKCFNFNNRNYIKLADIVAAANNNYEIKLESAQKHAKNGTGQAITTRPTTIDLKTSFDNKTNTIKIAMTTTDFQRLYEELYTKQQGKAPGEQVSEETPPKAVAQPEMTQAPEVGVILAKILKDEKKPAYIDGKPNIENITETYATTSAVFGQCTWYARGRFAEVTGIATVGNVYDVDGFADKFDLQVITDPNMIVSRSFAVFGDVHVVFVEYIERDAQGNPTYIYFSEANQGNSGVYKPDKDGLIQKLEFNKFINRQSTYKGCITLK